MHYEDCKNCNCLESSVLAGIIVNKCACVRMDIQYIPCCPSSSTHHYVQFRKQFFHCPYCNYPEMSRQESRHDGRVFTCSKCGCSLVILNESLNMNKTFEFPNRIEKGNPEDPPCKELCDPNVPF